MTDVALSFLGLCLTDPKAFDLALAKGVGLDCFEVQEQAALFGAMLEVERSGKSVSVVSVASARPDLANYLIALRQTAPITQSAEAYVQELLIERWRGKVTDLLRDAGGKLLRRRPFEPLDASRTALTEALSQLLAAPTDQSTGPKKLAAVLDKEIPKIETDRESGLASGIPTGIIAIDKLTSGGLKRGSVNVIAARTGVGKTTLALNVAHHCAMAGHAVCYFTVEMPAGQLARKLLSMVGQVKSARVMSGEMSQAEFDRLWEAQRALYQAPLWIDDTFRASLEAFETACRRLKRQAALDMVVVDYVQQLSIDGRYFSKQQLLTDVSHRIKQLALELDIAVLSLAQFNREAEKSGEEPSLWQIKDSGAIEQDADLGVCLFRDEAGAFWLKVDKNRWGKDRLKFPVDADLSMNIFRNAAVNFPEEF